MYGLTMSIMSSRKIDERGCRTPDADLDPVFLLDVGEVGFRIWEVFWVKREGTP